jgi:hypothetical protein
LCGPTLALPDGAPILAPEKLGGLAVEPLAQVFARFEEGYKLFGHRDGGSRARIAPLPRRAVLDRERSKTPQFNRSPRAKASTISLKTTLTMRSMSR